jgi:hypothetical protein
MLSAIGNKTVSVGQTLKFTISAADPDGDPLTYSASGLPQGASFNTSTHTFTWTPTEAGTYSVTFKVSDGTSSDSQVVTINVGGPPELSPIGNKAVAAGQTLQFTISATDPNGDTLSYHASNLPPGAAFDAATRTFSWTPAPEQTGLYSGVHFEVSDGYNTTSEDIAIFVGEEGSVVEGAALFDNVAPALNPIGDKRVTAGQMLQFMVSADDANYDVLTFSASNLPPGAELNPATRTFTWRPSEEQAGVYRGIGFEVSDGALTASESITITVDGADGTSPSIDSVAISEVSPASAVVRWTTDEPGTSQVEYWASPGQISPLDSDYVTEHAVRLTGLKPGTIYHYRTLSLDQAGNLSESIEQEFTTPPAFTVGGLTITPEKALVGEEVTVSVLVINNMDTAGTCELALRVGDAIESATTVDLGAGEQRLVSFTTTRYAAGPSLIDVNGATGTLLVIDPEPQKAGGFPVGLAFGVVPLVGAVFAGIWIYRRRRLA